MLLLAAMATSRGAADWEMNKFLISFWGGPHDEATARAVASANFNTVMCNADKLDLCRECGLRAIVMDATPELAATLQSDPAVWGHYVQDEPNAEQFEAAAERVAAFRKADPTRPGYVNLMAWMDLDQYLRTVRPKFLSYDYYQWWWGTHNHFGRLEAHRRAALEARIPLICWVEANADKRWEWGEEGATYLPDNAEKLRQSVYTSLAYGVKGIQWFNWTLIFELDENRRILPALKRSGEDIAAINAELQALGPILVELRSVDVFHTEPLPDDTKPIPADCWIEAAGKALVLGMFKDAQDNDYLMVVNRDVEHGEWAVVRFLRPVDRVEKFDRQAGKWVRLPMQVGSGSPTVELILRAGDGDLLRIQ